MKLNDYFALFHQKISLDSSRNDRIKKAHNTFRENIEKIPEIKSRLFETFLQGSYRIGTSIRPCNDNEFDVDVVISLNLNDETGDRMKPKEAVDFIYNHLKSISIYQGKLKKQPRCIRIDYSGDFHMDVVSAHYDKWMDILFVPNRKVEDWSETNPKGFIQWCVEQNKKNNDKFSRIIKYLKWWRNNKFGKDSVVKSIILTTLIGENFSTDCSTDADSILGSVKNLNDLLELYYYVPNVPNPSLITENLAREWNHSNYITFKNSISSLFDSIKDAYEEEDLEKSIEKWRKVFGEDFPSAEEVRASKIKEAQAKGELLVSSSGQILLTSEKNCDTHKIPTQRFYGGE
jgi:hypothetical protein